MIRAVAVAAAVLVALTGCSAGNTPAEPDTLSVVVLGDSLSGVPARACSGCDSYIEQYVDFLGKTTGLEVELHADALDDSQLSDVSDALTTSWVTGDLAEADVVIVWIGNNDGPPYNPDTPCGPAPGDTAEAQVAAVEAYDQDCIDATMDLYSERYADLFGAVRDLSPNASARFALTTYDNWRDNPAFVGPEYSPERLEAVDEKVVAIFDAWNAAQCASAEDSAFTCVDTYHLVNGADGRQPATASVGPDFTHLSQAGHDAVADLLASEGFDAPRG